MNPLLINPRFTPHSVKPLIQSSNFLALGSGRTYRALPFHLWFSLSSLSVSLSSIYLYLGTPGLCLYFPLASSLCLFVSPSFYLPDSVSLTAVSIAISNPTPWLCFLSLFCLFYISSKSLLYILVFSVSEFKVSLFDSVLSVGILLTHVLLTLSLPLFATAVRFEQLTLSLPLIGTAFLFVAFSLTLRHCLWLLFVFPIQLVSFLCLLCLSLPL